MTFDKNIAEQNGGAIYFKNQINTTINNSTIVTMAFNTANNYGGAIYSKITENTTYYFNISYINFSGNMAGVAGKFLYIDVHKSCNNSCIDDRIAGVSNKTQYQDQSIATSPKILKLYNTAKCIDNKTQSAECEQYYIENIMLGEEIILHPCLLDYYNQLAEVTQFSITSDKQQNYSVHGSEYLSISCNHTIKGISVAGDTNINMSSLPQNYSILITSNATQSIRKTISLNLTVGLTPCHPGFQYHKKSQRCECYNSSGIVSCAGSSSAIEQGYWFGYVNRIPTVTQSIIATSPAVRLLMDISTFHQ